MEIWKDIPEYEGLYKISNFGRIKALYTYKSPTTIKKYNSLTGEKILKQDFSKDYYRIMLCKNAIRKRFQVHRIVLLAFVRPPFPREEGNHLDGNTKNNHLNNLEWVTPEENTKHRITIGKYLTQSGELHTSSKLTNNDVAIIKKLHKDGTRTSIISKKFAVSDSTIRNIVYGRTWKHLLK